jgi:ribose 5-phosphate isomerase B
MKIVLGNDHCGFDLRSTLIKHIEKLGHEVTDVGTFDTDPVDFPDIVRRVITPIRNGDAERGVIACGTGVGASIAANKFPGIRAALCHDQFSAEQSVDHDDVNVLCLGAWIVGPVTAQEIVGRFLGATFSTEEHFRRRVEKLHHIERETIGLLADQL